MLLHDDRDFEKIAGVVPDLVLAQGGGNAPSDHL
jgi:ABC-type Fe3+-hydroxamate transport system substrate-binding protein